MLKSTRWLLLAISCAWVSCTPKPPDVPVCEALVQRTAVDSVTGHVILAPSPTCMAKIGEAECGHCVYIVSGKEEFIGEAPEHGLKGKPWHMVHEQSILLPAEESYAPLAAYIINSCKKANCSKDTQKFKEKLDSLEATKE